jgi:sec-independent protein translocase protein TatB
MPSFQDSALIFFLALLLFGPKKLPELARQLGKLMAEFRRASNEFRMQMEDELRVAEQAEQQKKIAAMEAAAPVTPAITDGTEATDGAENTLASPVAPPYDNDMVEVQPYSNSYAGHSPNEAATEAPAAPVEAATESATEPLPIATSGDLNLMPPSTGLPVSSSSISQAFSSIPRAPEPDVTSEPTPGHTATEAPLHG